MWVLNVFLYLCVLFDQAAYQQLVAQGAECWVYVAAWGDEDRAVVPACWYREAE
jgi:hypothetical protein